MDGYDDLTRRIRCRVIELEGYHVNSKIVTVLEALVHADNLAEHLPLILMLQLPQLREIVPRHPDRFNLAHALMPALNVRCLAVVTMIEAKNAAGLELAERLRDPVPKDVILRLDKASQDDADFEVREEHRVPLVLPNPHQRQ